MHFTKYLILLVTLYGMAEAQIIKSNVFVRTDLTNETDKATARALLGISEWVTNSVPSYTNIVADLTALAAYSGAEDSVLVADELRGGVFSYAASGYTADGGNVIAATGGGYWVRQNGGVVNVLDFGADPTGVADCVAAVTAAIGTGKHVFFPAGTYYFASMIRGLTSLSISGDKNGGTRFTHNPAIAPVGKYREGSRYWFEADAMASVFVSDIEFFEGTAALHIDSDLAQDMERLEIRRCTFTDCVSGVLVYKNLGGASGVSTTHTIADYVVIDSTFTADYDKMRDYDTWYAWLGAAGIFVDDIKIGRLYVDGCEFDNIAQAISGCMWGTGFHTGVQTLTVKHCYFHDALQGATTASGNGSKPAPITGCVMSRMRNISVTQVGWIGTTGPTLIEACTFKDARSTARYAITHAVKDLDGIVTLTLATPPLELGINQGIVIRGFTGTNEVMQYVVDGATTYRPKIISTNATTITYQSTDDDTEVDKDITGWVTGYDVIYCHSTYLSGNPVMVLGCDFDNAAVYSAADDKFKPTVDIKRGYHVGSHTVSGCSFTGDAGHGTGIIYLQGNILNIENCQWNATCVTNAFMIYASSAGINATRALNIRDCYLSGLTFHATEEYNALVYGTVSDGFLTFENNIVSLTTIPSVSNYAVLVQLGSLSDAGTLIVQNNHLSLDANIDVAYAAAATHAAHNVIMDNNFVDYSRYLLRIFHWADNPLHNVVIRNNYMSNNNNQLVHLDENYALRNTSFADCLRLEDNYSTALRAVYGGGLNNVYNPGYPGTLKTTLADGTRSGILDSDLEINKATITTQDTSTSELGSVLAVNEYGLMRQLVATNQAPIVAVNSVANLATMSPLYCGAVVTCGDTAGTFPSMETSLWVPVGYSHSPPAKWWAYDPNCIKYTVNNRTVRYVATGIGAPIAWATCTAGVNYVLSFWARGNNAAMTLTNSAQTGWSASPDNVVTSTWKQFTTAFKATSPTSIRIALTDIGTFTTSDYFEVRDVVLYHPDSTPSADGVNVLASVDPHVVWRRAPIVTPSVTIAGQDDIASIGMMRSVTTSRSSLAGATKIVDESGGAIGNFDTGWTVGASWTTNSSAVVNATGATNSLSHTTVTALVGPPRYVTMTLVSGGAWTVDATASLTVTVGGSLMRTFTNADPPSGTMTISGMVDGTTDEVVFTVYAPTATTVSGSFDNFSIVVLAAGDFLHRHAYPAAALVKATSATAPAPYFEFSAAGTHAANGNAKDKVIALVNTTVTSAPAILATIPTTDNNGSWRLKGKVYAAYGGGASDYDNFMLELDYVDGSGTYTKSLHSTDLTGDVFAWNAAGYFLIGANADTAAGDVTINTSSVEYKP